MALGTQLSVRLSDKQRDYLRRQVKTLRRADPEGSSTWSEGDAVRALIDRALQAEYEWLQSIPGKPRVKA